MSVSYGARLVVGYTYKEIMDILGGNEEDFEKIVYLDEILCRTPPYYDAANSSCIFGELIYDSGEYSYIQIGMPEISGKVQQAMKDLEDWFGVKPSLYLSTYGD